MVEIFFLVEFYVLVEIYVLVVIWSSIMVTLTYVLEEVSSSVVTSVSVGI